MNPTSRALLSKIENVIVSNARRMKWVVYDCQLEAYVLIPLPMFSVVTLTKILNDLCETFQSETFPYIRYSKILHQIVLWLLLFDFVVLKYHYRLHSCHFYSFSFKVDPGLVSCIDNNDLSNCKP